jgi:DNA-binding transcriptional regulator YiaG
MDDQKPMDATELRACMAAIGWSQQDLARVLHRAHGTIRQWARDARPIPLRVAKWLRVLRAFHEAHALPEGWELKADE